MSLNHHRKIALTLALSLSLTGCFETGENQGSNLLTINGSLLKGSARNADIIVYDGQSRMIWQGKSDDIGNYSAEISSANGQMYTIVSRITPQSTMICDAVTCLAPLSGNTYQFGDEMPGSELGNIEIKNSFYLTAPSDSVQTRATTQQVNSMSTLMVDVIAKDLSANTDQQSYQKIVNAANDVVADSLGIDVGNIPLLETPLPDINQYESTRNNDTMRNFLGIINAGQSSSLTRLERFSDALVTLTSSPDDPQARTLLSEAQQQIMAEALALLSDPSLGLASEELNQVASESLANGVDFTALEQSINALNIAAAEANGTVAPVNYTASSYQYGGQVSTASGAAPYQWWWVSDKATLQGTTEDKWLVLEYAQSFVPKRLEIGTNEQFAVVNPVIQVSTDGQQWQDLASLSDLVVNNAWVDNRKVSHLDLALVSEQSYRFYRLKAQGSQQIWLEYLCLSQTNGRQLTSKRLTTKRPEPISHCQSSEQPITTTPSNVAVSADNLKNPSNKTWWISELASPAPQWASIEYQQAFAATQASITVKAQNAGTSSVIQGSNDGIQWADIAAVASTPYPGEILDANGFRQFDMPLNNSQSYQYYRYYSQPTSFVWLAFLSFTAN